MEIANEMAPATTEISLKSDSATTGNGDKHGTSSSSAAATMGGQSFYNANAASIGSRLATVGHLETTAVTTGAVVGSSPGSRLASGDSATAPPSVNNTMSATTAGATMKSEMGFGNSVPRAAPVNKMTLQEVQQVAAVKAESFKLWGVKAFKCTKQLLAEKMGRGTRTVDLELEARVEVLRDTKQKYENIVALMKVFADHFSMMCQTQKVLGEAFGELAGKSQDLQEEFQFNGETQFVLAKNGESFLGAVNHFVNGMQTLCSKTMDDTLVTITRYESARVEYDAYRVELESLKLAPRTESNLNKQSQAQINFAKHKDIYERLRADVGVKLQFLDENRIKVMQQKLLMFHSAISAYFAGNREQLNQVLKQFNINGGGGGNNKPSWLEGGSNGGTN